MSQGADQGKITITTLKYDAGAFIALGSNVKSAAGLPIVTLGNALEALERRGAVIRAISRFYTTPAYPAGSGPEFVNAAAWIEADWTAPEFLGQLHEIETDLGRIRSVRWGPRVIDLDLLAIDDLVLPDAETYQEWHDLPLERQMADAPDKLILPHPRLHERAFVLIPLRDIAPDWRHPVSGLTVRQLCDALPEAAKSQVTMLE